MRRLSLALLVAALAASALLTASPALAAGSSACSRAVINDWYVDGHIDKTYPIACYRQALKDLPEDVKAYADAPDVITKAMHAAIVAAAQTTTTGGNDPQDPDTTTTGPDDGGDGGTNPTETGTNPTGTDPVDTTETETTETTGAGPSGGDGTDGPVSKAIDEVGPSDASSIPVPLIVLGVLALLLLAAGAAGVVARKLQERRMPATPGGSPPAGSPPAA